MMEAAEPMWADQHLSREGEQETLCGWLFEDLESPVKVWDYRDGFATKLPTFCASCAKKEVQP